MCPDCWPPKRFPAPRSSRSKAAMRKTVSVGAVYDDGIGARDVYAVLYNGRRHENVILVVHEIEHHALHLTLVHLPVPDRQSRLRDETLNERCDSVNGLDAVVYEEDLAATRQFQLDCRLDDRFGELQDMCLNRQTVERRSFNQRPVA